MYPTSPSAYDRAITVFSPDGRLFQVEYAREAVKKGTTALGIIYKEGVLLAVDKNITSRLLKGESVEKIFEIDNHIGTATSGLVADARKLIDWARVTAQEEKMTYNDPIDVEMLTKKICNIKQAYTQMAGARPFGASLLITGIDKSGKHLFETDPSGAFNEWYAVSIGSGKKEVDEYFEKNYRNDLTFDDAVELCLKALTKVGDRKISTETIDIQYIDEKKRKASFLEKAKLDKYIQKILSGKRNETK